MTLLTPNMNLPYSTINVDTGLTWEQNLNNALGVSGGGIDSHNHTSGNGVAIPPEGLNINKNLNFNGYSPVNIGSAVFNQQLTLSTLNALFVGTDGNLYFNDGDGDPSIQITAGGVVNATSSGISSGTATASFVTSVLVVNAASNTPANIQGGSLLIGNNVAASKFLTLAPPSAMAVNYSLTLPNLPASTLPVTLSNAGVFSTSQISTAMIANGAVTTTQIASATITSANIAITTIVASNISDATITIDKLAVMTVNDPAPIGGVMFVSPVSTTTASTSYVTIASSALACGGRPVKVSVQPSPVSAFPAAYVGVLFSAAGATASAQFRFLRDGNQIGEFRCGSDSTRNNGPMLYPPGSLSMLDCTPSAGSHTYSLQMLVTDATNTAAIQNCAFVAYEI